MRRLPIVILIMILSTFGRAFQSSPSPESAARPQQNAVSAQQKAPRTPAQSKASNHLQAEASAPQVTQDSTPVPVWVTYRFFFLHSANLENVATQE